MSRFDINEVLRPATRRPLRHLPRITFRSIGMVRRAAPREFLVAAGLQAVAGAGVAVQLLAGRRVLEQVVGGDLRVDQVLPSLIALAVVTALVSFAQVARTEQQRVLTELVGSYAIDKVLDVATRVPLDAYETPGFHDRLERAKVNAVVRPVSTATGVMGLIGAGFAVVGIAAALFVLQPMFLVLVFVGYAPAWLLSARASRAMHDFAAAQTERDRRRAYLLQVLTGKTEAQEVRAFNLGGFLRSQHDRLYREKITDLRTVVRRRLRLGLAGAVIASTLTGFTLAALVWFVATSRMGAAEAGTAAGAVVLLGQRLRAVANAASSLYEGALFLEDFTSFVESSARIDGSQPGGTPPRGFEQLTVDGVTFTYPSRRQPSLHGISMRIRRGEVVALVGENGSGKTTLAKLLAGLHHPDAGRIRWDGVETSTCDPALLRESVAVIFQDFVRYHLTAAENVGVGRHQRYGDTEAVVRAAARAGIHDTLSAFDDGYDTVLGPHFFGGSDLSLGQWQRVALARAFFRDAPFIVLDEPTASLDPRAEAALFADIRDLCRGSAVLLISHRFSSVRSADRIYVLRDGRVVEHGTHDDLMARDGYYAELFRLQAASYVDAPPVEAAT